MSVRHLQAGISGHPSRIRRQSFATNGKVLPRDAQTKGCVPLSADLYESRRRASPQGKKSMHGISLCRFHVDVIVGTLLIARHHLVLQRPSRHLSSASQQPVFTISVVQKLLACPTPGISVSSRFLRFCAPTMSVYELHRFPSLLPFR